MDERPIKVSIRCTTFNHIKFIRKCLDGFIMQKTNFPFEAIVHDDASTDGTTEVVREYAEKYPKIIKPIFEIENQYSKHDGYLRKIMKEAGNGKYVAICEGDDYWTDPNKLQKQVDFLEEHPDYSMCFHNSSLLNETDIPLTMEHVESRDYSANELYKDWIVPTASIVAKRIIFDTMVIDQRIINGDINIVLNAFNYGKVRGLSDVMSVYRRQSNGLTINRVKENNLLHQISYITHWHVLKELYPFISNSLYKEKLGNTYLRIAIAYITLGSPKSLLYIVRAFLVSPLYVVKRLLLLVKHKMFKILYRRIVK